MLRSSYNKILLFELEFCKTYIKNKENKVKLKLKYFLK